MKAALKNNGNAAPVSATHEDTANSPILDMDYVTPYSPHSAGITVQTSNAPQRTNHSALPKNNIEEAEEYVEESLSLQDAEKEMIQKALAKHRGRRKAAAEDLNISERTLYRKIKEYDLD